MDKTIETTRTKTKTKTKPETKARTKHHYAEEIVKSFIEPNFFIERNFFCVVLLRYTFIIIFFFDIGPNEHGHEDKNAKTRKTEAKTKRRTNTRTKFEKRQSWVLLGSEKRQSLKRVKV
jgi:hypothetical protein